MRAESRGLLKSERRRKGRAHRDGSEPSGRQPDAAEPSSTMQPPRRSSSRRNGESDAHAHHHAVDLSSLDEALAAAECRELRGKEAAAGSGDDDPFEAVEARKARAGAARVSRQAREAPDWQDGITTLVVRREDAPQQPRQRELDPGDLD